MGGEPTEWRRVHGHLHLNDLITVMAAARDRSGMSLSVLAEYGDELLHVLDVGLVDAAILHFIWVFFAKMPVQTLLIAIHAMTPVNWADPRVFVLGQEQSVVAQMSGRRRQGVQEVCGQAPSGN